MFTTPICLTKANYWKKEGRGDVIFENGRLGKKWVYNPKTASRTSLQTIAETWIPNKSWIPTDNKTNSNINTFTIKSISYMSISENELLSEIPKSKTMQYVKPYFNTRL